VNRTSGWPSRPLILAVVLAGLAVITPMAQSASARQHDPNKAEVLTLPLMPEGFVARTVTVEAGLYWIDLLNRSTVQGLNIEIDRMQGSKITDPVAEHAANGHDDPHLARFLKGIRLVPGTYRVTITGHPAWVCAIVVVN
jgi:hypothetical protein